MIWKGTVVGSVGIDDNAMNTATTGRLPKINTSINSAISALVNGAPDLLNDLIAAWQLQLPENAGGWEAISLAIADDRIRYKAEQTLPSNKKALARKEHWFCKLCGFDYFWHEGWRIDRPSTDR